MIHKKMKEGFPKFLWDFQSKARAGQNWTVVKRVGYAATTLRKN